MAELPSLTSAEAQAEDALRPVLEQPQRIAHLTHGAIGAVSLAILACANRPLPPSAVVTIRLLNRASNDLRGAALLARTGYVAQVASLCASLLESILAAAYVGRDEALAQEWLNHDDPSSSFRSVKHLADELADAFPVGRAGDPYTLYRRLCVPKHVNPLFETKYGATIIDGVPLLVNGPDISAFASRTTWLALTAASEVTAMALGRLADRWLGAKAFAVVGESVKGILEQAQSSRSEFLQRWSEDFAS